MRRYFIRNLKRFLFIIRNLRRFSEKFSSVNHVVFSNGKKEVREMPFLVGMNFVPSTLIRHENAALFLRLGLSSTIIRHEDGAFPKQMTDDDNCVSNFSGAIWTENI